MNWIRTVLSFVKEVLRQTVPSGVMKSPAIRITYRRTFRIFKLLKGFYAAAAFLDEKGNSDPDSVDLPDC